MLNLADGVEHSRNRTPHKATEMMEIENLIRYTELAVGLMDFEKIFRSPDIHPWHALLRKVRCRHAEPFTCPSRSGRPATTCAIMPLRPLCVHERQRSCAARPACRLLSRRAHACCVRAIRNPSLAG